MPSDEIRNLEPLWLREDGVLCMSNVRKWVSLCVRPGVYVCISVHMCGGVYVCVPMVAYVSMCKCVCVLACTCIC